MANHQRKSASLIAILVLTIGLLSCIENVLTASLAQEYCNYVVNSALNDKLTDKRNMTDLGLNIASSYNPGINYEDFSNIYAYKAEYPRLYPLLNCHLKVTPNNSRPGWIHDFTNGLNVALKKLVKYEFETFRGTGLDNIPQIGDLLQNSGFLSTSKSAHVASGFASNRYMFRFSKSGGRDITGVEGLPFQGELEVIVPPGKCFRVIAMGNGSQWWRDMSPSFVSEYNANITFIDLMKVKCPKDGKNYWADTNNDVLSMPNEWELENFKREMRLRSVGAVNDVPNTWKCSPSSYNSSDGCDCGCGAFDPDCLQKTSSLFNCPSSGAYFCNSTTASCERVISKYGPVPVEWKCMSSYYGDGICNCECGYPDPDCQSQTYDSFAYGCLVNQFCNAKGKCENKKYVPSTWTCSPQYYNSSDGCDCGCGEIDPDCYDSSQEVLNCPCATMNCTLGHCTGECNGISLMAVPYFFNSSSTNPTNPDSNVVLIYKDNGIFAASIVASFLGGSFITVFVMVAIYFIAQNCRKKKMPANLQDQFIQLHNQQ